MSTISRIQGLEILDSRGHPTALVRLELTNGIVATATVPSGASTGAFEAIERRDGDPNRYNGKGVQEVIASINTEIDQALKGKDVLDQTHLDLILVTLDGTENKSRLGANALLGTSLAIARAGAQFLNIPLFRYLGGCGPTVLPCPMFNILNGGAHADNSIDFQEFMIRPHAASTFAESIRWAAEIYHSLRSLLKKQGFNVSVGDEGGFAPNLTSDEQALQLIVEAISKAGYKPGQEISIAMDCAASELYDQDEKRYIEKKHRRRKESFKARTTDEQIAYLEELVQKYPIDSIEDGLTDVDDWDGWHRLNTALGEKIQIVGDDLFVTNPKFLERGIREQSANAILIKLNQIGTVTETMEAIAMASRAGWTAIVSHRSGETEDTTIADLAVGAGTGQIKTGSLSRTDRVAKYNRLLRIEEELGESARYAGLAAFGR